jgi:hypothetical protein
MAVPGAAIHAFPCFVPEAWMAGPSPAMTKWRRAALCCKVWAAGEAALGHRYNCLPPIAAGNSASASL